MHLKISAEFITMSYQTTHDPVQVNIIAESYSKAVACTYTVPMEYLVNNSMMDMFFNRVKQNLKDKLGGESCVK